MLGPLAIFLILLGIGVAIGVLFDRLVGPPPMMVTSSLVGIAGSFIGGHIAGLIGIRGYGSLVGAAIGAAAVLWGWRMAR
jgi:uncharacterized membrane protein YeaQ/YmgE (transglycosylase-associated protein family)